MNEVQVCGAGWRWGVCREGREGGGWSGENEAVEGVSRLLSDWIIVSSVVARERRRKSVSRYLLATWLS